MMTKNDLRAHTECLLERAERYADTLDPERMAPVLATLAVATATLALSAPDDRPFP